MEDLNLCIAASIIIIIFYTVVDCNEYNSCSMHVLQGCVHVRTCFTSG